MAPEPSDNSALKEALKKPLILSLILLGFLYLGYIVTLPKDTVFFSGDGGLKYLMATQFLSGNISPSLVLPSKGAGLWDNGFYPFDVPFVYTINNRKVVSFPLYFPLLSAPFLGALGWRGLYVLPAVGVILTWLWVLLRCRNVCRSTAAICAALVSLMFASPITLYGGMFWEHAPAVFLASLPLAVVLITPGTVAKPAKVACLGCLSGTGAFLRPELLAVLPATMMSSLLCLERERIREIGSFSLGFLAAVSAFLTANLLIYGHILGMHSSQVLEGGLLSPSHAHKAIELGLLLVTDFLHYWPACVFVFVGFPIALLFPCHLKREMCTCFLTLVVSIPLVAMMVPNAGGKEWGPRYLLMLIPWGAVTLGLVLETILQHGSRWIAASVLALLMLTVTLGVKVNVWDGTKHIADDYRYRISPALKSAAAQPEQYIIITHQWIAQELAALAAKKTFLLVRSRDAVQRAKANLLQQGIHTALLVTFRGGRAAGEFSISREVGRSGSYIVSVVEMGDRVGRE
jgi:hypothetical protein